MFKEIYGGIRSRAGGSTLILHLLPGKTGKKKEKPVEIKNDVHQLMQGKNYFLCRAF